ncbi:MAG: peptidyl-prolyl cis-trans isomerase [Polyangiaceae bacterium]|nr:peptidyl-prolyl cis-trans isomerase [Polyangiaceae bacterium]
MSADGRGNNRTGLEASRPRTACGTERRRVAFTLVVVGSMGLGMGGCRCGEQPPTGSSALPSASVGALAPELAGRVLAKVGDRSITLGDYVAALERMDRFERVRYQSPKRRQQLLDEMINVELLAAEARRRGLDRDPVVQNRIDQVLRDLVLSELHAGLPGPEAIPEAEVREYYAAHRGDFSIPERRRLSVIVLPNRKAAEQVLEAARQATAARWGELVRKHSVREDPPSEGADGLLGDVGFVTVPGVESDVGPGEVPDAVRRAGFGIARQGEVFPEVIEANGQAFIVRLVTKNVAGTRSFAEAERSIRVTLAQQRIRAAEERFERQLRERFEVQVDRAALATVRSVPSAAPATPSSASETGQGGDRRTP